MFHWKYSEKIWFEIGPYFGVLLSDYEEDQLGEIPERRPFNDFEFGLGGGLNVRLVNNLIANARYSSSIIPVREHQSGETYRLNKGQYNSVLSFSIMFQFSDRRNQ